MEYEYQMIDEVEVGDVLLTPSIHEEVCVKVVGREVIEDRESILIDEEDSKDVPNDLVELEVEFEDGEVSTLTASASAEIQVKPQTETSDEEIEK